MFGKNKLTADQVSKLTEHLEAETQKTLSDLEKIAPELFEIKQVDNVVFVPEMIWENKHLYKGKKASK